MRIMHVAKPVQCLTEPCCSVQHRISPSLSMQRLSRYRSTPEPKRWPALLPVAFGAALVFPSHRSSDACCAYKIRASNNKSIIYTRGDGCGANVASLLCISRKHARPGPNTMCHFLQQSGKYNKTMSYSQNSTTALVRLAVSTML